MFSFAMQTVASQSPHAATLLCLLPVWWEAEGRSSSIRSVPGE